MAMALATGLATAVQIFRDLNRSLTIGVQRYFDQPTFSDVTIVAPSGRRLRCHQLVLSACSRRFAAILEAGGFLGKDLPVQGVDSDALETVLRFFYTGDCALSVSTAIPLLDAATKLEVQSLAAACEQFINQVLHPVTVMVFLEQSMNLKMEPLAEALLTYIRGRFEEVILSDAFLQVASSTLLKLMLDNKQRQSESVLFRAASKWLLADPKRVDSADEVFRLVGMSSAAVHSLVHQNALDLLQPLPGGSTTTAVNMPALLQPPSAPDNPVSEANTHLSHLLTSADGSQAGTVAAGTLPLAALQNLPTLQLLPNGNVVPVSGLALSLQHGLTSLPATALQGADGSQSGLLALFGQHLDPNSIENLQNMIAAAAAGGVTPASQQQQQQQPQQQQGQGAPEAKQLPTALTVPATRTASNGGGPAATAAVPKAASEAHAEKPGPGPPSMSGSVKAAPASLHKRRSVEGGARVGGNSTWKPPAASPAPALSMETDGISKKQEALAPQPKSPVSTGGRRPKKQDSSKPLGSGHGGSFGESSTPFPRANQASADADGSSSSKTLLNAAMQLYSQPSADLDQDEHLSAQLPPPPTLKGVCHVDNCLVDLTTLRDYHQRFKICDYHLKVSSIMKDGVPQRFCQQCGRFHLLQEFDGNKRSCRARLQRHNARRRKKAEAEAAGAAAATAQRPIIREASLSGADVMDEEMREPRLRSPDTGAGPTSSAVSLPSSANRKKLPRPASQLAELAELAAEQQRWSRHVDVHMAGMNLGDTGNTLGWPKRSKNSDTTSAPMQQDQGKGEEGSAGPDAGLSLATSNHMVVGPAHQEEGPRSQVRQEISTESTVWDGDTA